jgi:hyaluronoglucosaminidase
VAGAVGAALLHRPAPAAAQSVQETVDIAPPGGEPALKLRPSGPVAPSTSVGGALNLDNSASQGAGTVLYSNRGTDALGRLLVVNQANPANPQQAVRIQNAGTAHAVSILHDPAGGAGDSSAEAVDIVSTNPLDTTLGIQGQEEGRGTVKITHEKPVRSDANAAALSIALQGSGTACQGIFIGNDAGNPTTGKLLNIRNGGPSAKRLALTADS